MEKILNITNGDCTIDVMKTAHIPGAFLPWRDVLHEGPVPAGLSLERLSEVRSRFIIERGWGDADKVKQDFIERDNTLKSYDAYDRIILWFEHDLYDQLQILQILDWFHLNRPKTAALSIICVDKYLGTLSPDDMATLHTREVPVSKGHLELSARAWSAFRSETPEKWAALLKTDTSVLPYLEGAVVRMLEEYPSCRNGLSRSAQQTLRIISEGEKRPARVFGRYQESEQRRFMGDSSFWAIPGQFLESSPPLLKAAGSSSLTLPTSPDQELTITPRGADVLSGKCNWLDIVQIDQWIGGVHLTPDNIWCWNATAAKIEKILAECC